MRRKKGFYSISAVAKMFSVHQQTIRVYEREGLLTPKRSDGNTRLFSEEDIERLEEIINLTHTAGVNLAGVEIILRLQKKISKLQNEMNALFGKMQSQLSAEDEAFKAAALQSSTALQRLKIREKNKGNAIDIQTEKKETLVRGLLPKIRKKNIE